jgi:hypothetical protein
MPPLIARPPTVLACVLLLCAAAAGAEELPAVVAGKSETIRPAIAAAARAGRRQVVIPAGTYRIPAFDGRWWLALTDLADLELDGRGATLVLEGAGNGFIELWRCRNVTLRGFTLLHDPVPFTQGRIEAFGADGRSIDLRIAAGFPAAFDDPRLFPKDPTGYVFDPATRQWKTGGWDLYSQRVERLGDGRFRLHYGNQVGPAVQPIAVGDLLAFRGKGLTDIHVADCAGCAIDGVAIRSGGGFCVHEDGGAGGNRYTYSVGYGPRPAGADEDPLIACNADAFHSSNARKGPQVEHCRFAGMCDDGIAIHGSYALVAEAAGSSVVVTERGDWRVGDRLRFVDLAGGVVAEAVLKAVTAQRDYRPAGRSRYRPYEDLERRHFTTLELDHPVPAAFDWLVSDADAIGSGYVLRGNTIRNHRARGMLLKAEDGLVEGNTVDGSTIAGIVLSPEFWWNEACCSRNVAIRGNTISHTGYATHVGGGQNQSGALTLCGEAKPGATPGHRGITIAGNTFRECDGTNLLIDFAQGVEVTGNVFEKPMRVASRRGADHTGDLAAAIWVGRLARDVRIAADNRVVDPGPAFKRLAAAASEATGVGLPPEGAR